MCFKCHEPKPLSEFYKHSRMADGHVNKCKDCNKKDVSTNRTDKLDYYQQYDRGRGSLPHRVEARLEYQQTEAYRVSHNKSGKKQYRENKEVHLERQRESRKVNRGKHRAREEVAYAVKMGKLIKPATCQNCGNDGLIHGHHCDYNKPLDVMWLCTRCHGKWHRDNVAIDPV